MGEKYRMASIVRDTLPINGEDDEEVSASKKADEQRKPGDSYQIWSHNENEKWVDYLYYFFQVNL